MADDRISYSVQLTTGGCRLVLSPEADFPNVCIYVWHNVLSCCCDNLTDLAEGHRDRMLYDEGENYGDDHNFTNKLSKRTEPHDRSVSDGESSKKFKQLQREDKV